MSSPFSGFANLPAPFKAGVIIAGGGGLIGTLYLFIRHFDARVIWIILIGLAIVALMLFAYKMVLNWLQKRKSKDFHGGVETDSAQKPGGISKAEHLARLDDLQKRMEEGIEKFRVAGKDLYSLPWVMIVGEPGSGKTEAIRHCNVGFPPGLHEPLQGTGGTINMNWWFTDHAVILDTAGRLMFEELEAGRTTEWQHFLNLLKKYRRNCPINGILLVIPADTLSTDTADQIEHKAEKIAQQFDTIRRTLDVRFPVFVVVAKTDKIDGFREFFDDLTDPQLQHQILGWSSPAPLDEPFNPEMIDKYLETIQARLRRYRMGLLRDPVPGESAQRRTDEVDSLFAFPRQLLKVAPRLRRYLELVFSVGGQWSGKPLFLRGIYFTSSMREGEALDVELAETLGVPVESLPDGKVWEKDRAYFLRDLFINKVFREKGLVTRAANARRQNRWRKAAVLGAAAFSALLLLLFTAMGAYSLDDSIGKVSDYFVAAKNEGENCRYWVDNNPQMYWFPIVEQRTPGSTEYIYVGNQPLEFFENSPTRIRFLSDFRRQVDKGVKIPGVFLLARAFTDAVESENLQKTQRTLFEAAVLRPLADAARWKLIGGANAQPQPWTPPLQPAAAAALAQLIRLEAFRLGLETPANSADQAKYQWTEPLLDYVLFDSEELIDQEQFEQDKQSLNALARQTYQTAADWPPPLISLHHNSIRILAPPDRAIYQGVESFIDYWKGQGGLQQDALENIRRIEVALKEFDAAEQNLLKVAQEFVRQENQLDSSEKLKSLLTPWDPAINQLSSAAVRVNALVDALEDITLAQAYDQGVQQVLRQMKDSFAPLLGELPPESQPAPAEPSEPPPPPPTETPDNILLNVRRQLDQAARTVEGQLLKKEYIGALQLLQERFLAPSDQYRLYQIRTKIWEIAQEQLNAPVAIAGAAELADAIDQIDRRIENARVQIGDLARAQQSYLLKDTAAAAASVLKTARRRRTSLALNQALASLPKSSDAISNYVAERATNVAGPRIPLTKFDGRDFDVSYDPAAAAPIFGVYNRMQTRLNDLTTPLLDRNELGLAFNQFKQGYVEYVGRYYNYWAYTVPRQLESGFTDWKGFFAELSRLTTFGVRSPLDALGKKMEAAFIALQNAVPPELSDDIKTALNHINLNREKNINRNDAHQIYAQQCDKILSSLNSLGADSFAASQTLIQLSARDLRERFLITPERAPLPVEYVDYFWFSLNRSAWQLLVQEMEALRREALEQLRLKCDRFPLNRPQPDDLRFMTPQEIAQARIYYNRVSFAGVELARQETVRTGIDEIDKLIENLRRPRGLSPDDSLWLDRIGQVLSALPERPGTFTPAGSVRLPDQQTQKKILAAHQIPNLPDAHLIAPVWRYLALKQGALETNAGTENPQEASLGQLIYGADGIAFNFFRYSDSPADRSLTLQNPWAPMRLLHQGTVKDVHSTQQQPLSCSWQLIPPQQAGPFLLPTEPPDRVWLVKLAITGNEPNETRWICIKLVFDKPLPSPENWPAK